MRVCVRVNDGSCTVDFDACMKVWLCRVTKTAFGMLTRVVALSLARATDRLRMLGFFLVTGAIARKVWSAEIERFPWTSCAVKWRLGSVFDGAVIL